MKLTERRVFELLAAFRAPAPAPGGGSASALAGAVGAALLTMIGSMPKHRAATDEDVDRLRAVAERCTALSERLLAFVDEDAEAYEKVVAAYRLPKDSPADKSERSARIQESLRRATDLPLAVMRHCAEAIEASAVVAAFGSPNASSDVGVALELLSAGGRGAKLNVEINLGTLKDEPYVSRVRQELAALDAECERGAAAARARLAEARQ